MQVLLIWFFITSYKSYYVYDDVIFDNSNQTSLQVFTPVFWYIIFALVSALSHKKQAHTCHKNKTTFSSTFKQFLKDLTFTLFYEVALNMVTAAKKAPCIGSSHFFARKFSLVTHTL